MSWSYGYPILDERGNPIDSIDEKLRHDHNLAICGRLIVMGMYRLDFLLEILINFLRLDEARLENGIIKIYFMSSNDLKMIENY